MTLGLNIGAGVGWAKPGWESIDHKRQLFRRGGTAWNTNFPPGRFDLVFSSHVFEHIPHFKADAVLAECNRVLKPAGGIRILCPNLAVIVRAYYEKDAALLATLTSESTIREDLGLGGQLMNFVVSPGADSLLFSRGGECIGGYAHVYSYDFDMLRVLLERNGFGEVIQCQFGESRYPEMSEPLHPIGTEPVWKLEKLWADRSLGITGFDRNPAGSLIVEAIKISEVTYPTREFGAQEELGLDPDKFDWISISHGYAHFTAVKVSAVIQKIPAKLKRKIPAKLKPLLRSALSSIMLRGHR